MDNINSILSISLIVLICVDFGQSKCVISKDWAALSVEERLLMSEVVVYGKTKEHRANVKKIAGKSYYEIDAVFEVYCVLQRGEWPIKEEILIERIAPRDGCSGTREHMKIGDEAVVGLRRTGDGTYEYDEVMPAQSVSFAASKMNFYSISSVCDLQYWSAPVDATVSRCPICGIGNFTQSAMDSAQNEKMKPCFIDGIQINNADNCNVFMTNSMDTNGTCLPADFNQTCARVLYNRPSVSCECTSTPVRQMNLAGLGEIDAADLTLPCLSTIIMSFWAILLSA